MSDKMREAALAPCPFCNGGMQFRKALWPSDGNCDAVIHAGPNECGLVEFADGSIDESVIGKWNARFRPVTAGAADAPRLPAGWLNDQLDKAAERAASMPAWMVNPNAPPAASSPSVIDFLKQWDSRESRPVIDVARDMVEAWPKFAAAQPASPAVGREVELSPEQLFIINDMTHAWIENPIRYRMAFRSDCKRLLASAFSPHEPVGAASDVAALGEIWDTCNRASFHSKEALASKIAAIVEARSRARLASALPGAPGADLATPADAMVGQIEVRFPNWRSFRDLLDCIDCTLHDLRNEAGGPALPRAEREVGS